MKILNISRIRKVATSGVSLIKPGRNASDEAAVRRLTVFTSQVKAATWALDRDISVVIADGFGEHTIRGIMTGKKVGTFFTKAKAYGTPIETQAEEGRAISSQKEKSDTNVCLMTENPKKYARYKHV